MSLKDGMAAINLEMPNRVPRTEYSADQHWELINNVIGTSVTHNSPAPERRAASQAFIKAWNYDFIWSTTIHAREFGDLRQRNIFLFGLVEHVEQTHLVFKILAA